MNHQDLVVVKVGDVNTVDDRFDLCSAADDPRTSFQYLVIRVIEFEPLGACWGSALAGWLIGPEPCLDLPRFRRRRCHRQWSAGRMSTLARSSQKASSDHRLRILTLLFPSHWETFESSMRKSKSLYFSIGGSQM